MKYRNKKTTVNGITFDSKKEAQRYMELMMLQKAGVIEHLRCQVEFELIPAQHELIRKDGKLKKGKLLERKCVYKADFVYFENGQIVVEDVKGMKTKDYIIKRKLMLQVHGVRIREV
jgi:hypothetical protein